MKYYDNAQLIEERKAYDVQMQSFENEVMHLWDVLEMVYVDSKFMKGVVDFTDLAKRYKNKIKRKIKSITGDPLYEDIDKSWDEIAFIPPAETQVEQMNRTYVYDKDHVKKRLVLMRNKLQKMYSYKYPIQRRVIEERLSFLETDFNKFDYIINPYHIQPGLLLDVDITSIKRKKGVLMGMANVLNEFLHGVSKGFQDAAFASFSRRRSTVREDISMSFGSAVEEEESEAAGKSYLDMLNAPAEVATSEAPGTVIEEEPKPAKRGRRKAKSSTGVVDSGPKKRGRKKASDSGLKSL
jgi:hypothetical protein